MITITINDREFKVANSYDELSLGQYVDIMKLSEKNIKNSTESDIEMISVLSDDKDGIRPLLWEFNVSDFDELTKLFSWVADSDYLEHLKGLKPKESIIVDGVEYGIISDFNKQMSLGEVISFETLIKQENSDHHKLEIAFGVLLRPIENGKLVKFSEDVFQNVIKNKYKVNMTDVYSVIVFFLSGGTKSTTRFTKAFSVRDN